MRARVVVFWVVVAAFLVPALAVTGARLFGPDYRVGIELVAFTPLAIPVYVVVLLLVLVRIALVRRWRDAALAVALVAVAALVLHGWWYAPQLTGANPPPADGAARLVVMTANLRLGQADGIEVVRIATEQHVDLLVLEEVTPAVLADMDRAGLPDLLPQRIGQAGSMASGTMAFSRNRLTDAVRLPTALGTWSFEMDDLRVLAVHPTYPVDAPGWKHEQAVVLRAVTGVKPDLVLGDFNATADHSSMRTLADRGYRDVGELANTGWQPTWPANGRFDLLGRPLAQIDHVLVGDRVAALDMRTAAIPGSDHRAVVAVVARK